MSLTWLAFTTQGFMVGDYIGTSSSGGLAFAVIGVAGAGTPTQNLNEAMFVDTSGLSIATSGLVPASAAGSHAATAPISFVVPPLNR